jgi:hypothetical protein
VINVSEKKRKSETLLPLRELLSPRAFFRRTFKMDRFSVLTADNKYKLEVLNEVYKRRDLAFRYACLFSLGMLIYCMVSGLLSFNLLLANKTFAFYYYLPRVDIFIIAPILLVFFPALFALMMKQAGVLFTIIVFMIFTGIYILQGYYIFVPFTAIGAVIFLRQNAVLDIYEVLSEEEGFPDFSDFTFSHEPKETSLKDTD